MSGASERAYGALVRRARGWAVLGLIGFALVSLTGCASAPIVTQVRTVEVPVEVVKPIPAELITPLPYPALEAETTVEGLVEALYQALDTVDRCNADRASVRAISPISAD